jgi:hypothetical protein
MTGPDVAAYLGITSATFAKWVANGRAPKPLPGTRRWDRKAIDLTLDRLSGIPPAPMSREDLAEEAVQQWLRDDEARNAARKRDPEHIRKKAAQEAALARRRGRQKPPV